jgi:hypothetical protein
MRHAVAGGESISLTLTIIVEADELIAEEGAGERLEASVMRLLEDYPEARLTIATELTAGAHADPLSELQ